jgi:hypothetical protein
MAATFTLIQTISMTSNTQTLLFSSIPNTFTDLYLVMAPRQGGNANYYYGEAFTINGSLWNGASATTSTQALQGDGNLTGYSNTSANQYGPAANAGTNVFGCATYYFPNYTVSIAKPVSMTYAVPQVGTGNWFVNLEAVRNTSTAQISSISVAMSSGQYYVPGSIFSLYGIKST